MAVSCLNVNTLQHGFGALYDVPRQNSVILQCCPENVLNKILVSDEAMAGTSSVHWTMVQDEGGTKSCAIGKRARKVKKRKTMLYSLQML